MNENVTSGKLKINLKWIWNQRQTKMEASFGGDKKTEFKTYQNGGVHILNALLLEREI